MTLPPMAKAAGVANGGDGRGPGRRTGGAPAERDLGTGEPVS
jgi:hypothetical protein